METSIVEDAELLYRSVRNLQDLFSVVEGKLRVSENAFNDPEFKPSVDRSSMRTDPKDARLSETDGVLAVSAQEVRGIATVLVNPADRSNTDCYAVDAIHRPLTAEQNNGRDNLAHCQVECQPGITRNHFNKKLRNKLAQLAETRGWIVSPQ